MLLESWCGCNHQACRTQKPGHIQDDEAICEKPEETNQKCLSAMVLDGTVPFKLSSGYKMTPVHAPA